MLALGFFIFFPLKFYLSIVIIEDGNSEHLSHEILSLQLLKFWKNALNVPNCRFYSNTCAPISWLPSDMIAMIIFDIFLSSELVKAFDLA